MAHIVEETITITFSRLVKGDDKPDSAVTAELLATIESVAQELVEASVIVEVKG